MVTVTVSIMSAIALLLAAAVSPRITLAESGAADVLVTAAASALVEVASPHGWDTLTMQVVPSALAWSWLA